jgi:inner membrane protein
MMWLTHLIVSLLITLSAAKVLGIADAGAMIIFAVIGALAPDIDHPQSFISRANPLTAFTSKIVSEHIEHRTYTHTLEAAVVFMVLSFFIALALGFNLILSSIGAFIGYFGHLFADSFTKSKVPWLIKNIKTGKRYGIPLVRTGSKGETVFLIIFVIAWAYLMGI